MHIGTIYGNRPRNRIAVRNDAPSWKCGSIIFLFRKDLKKIGLGLLGMFMDMIGNLNLYIHNRDRGKFGLCQNSHRNISENRCTSCDFHDPNSTSGTYRKTAGSSGRRLSDCSGNRIFTYRRISSGNRSE